MIDRSLTSDAPRQVELTSFDTDEGVQICAVDLLCTDELLPIRDFTVTVECAEPKRVVRAGRYEVDIPFSYSDGRATFRVRGLVMFEMYRVII